MRGTGRTQSHVQGLPRGVHSLDARSLVWLVVMGLGKTSSTNSPQIKCQARRGRSLSSPGQQWASQQAKGSCTPTRPHAEPIRGAERLEQVSPFLPSGLSLSNAGGAWRQRRQGAAPPGVSATQRLGPLTLRPVLPASPRAPATPHGPTSEGGSCLGTPQVPHAGPSSGLLRHESQSHRYPGFDRWPTGAPAL